VIVPKTATSSGTSVPAIISQEKTVIRETISASGSSITHERRSETSRWGDTQTNIVDLAGRWNDADAAQVAKELVSKAATAPWVLKFSETNKRAPRIRISEIIVRAIGETINTEIFKKKVCEEFLASGKVVILEGGLTSTKGKDQNAENNPDFILNGEIGVMMEVKGQNSVSTYTVTLRIINLTTGAKVWQMANDSVKKEVQRKNARWGGIGDQDRPQTSRLTLSASTPAWVANPTQDGKCLGASGIAEPMLAGMDTQRMRAKLHADSTLASMQTNKIRDVITIGLQDSGLPFSTYSTKEVSAAIKRLADTIGQMISPQQRDLWVDESTGRLFVYVVSSPEGEKRLIGDCKKAVRECAEIRGLFASSGDAAKAFALIDKAIDTHFAVTTPQTK
jgi:hypothetical protein